MAYPNYTTPRSLAGAASATYLSSSVPSAYSAGQSIVVANTVGWYEVSSSGTATTNPLGTSGVFTLVVDYGLATEEKILCASGAIPIGSNVTIPVWTDGTYNGRGWDGTPIVSHDVGNRSNINVFLVRTAVDDLQYNNAALTLTNNYIALSGTVSGQGSQITTISNKQIVDETNINNISIQLEYVANKQIVDEANIVSLSGSLATLSGQYVTTSGIVTGQTSSIASISGSLNTLSGQFVALSGAYATTSGNLNTTNSNLSTLSGQYVVTSGIVTNQTGYIATISGKQITDEANIASLSGSLATLSGQFVALSGSYASTSGSLNTVSGVAYGALQRSGGTISGALNITSPIIGGVTATSGQAIVWNSTQWVPATVSGGGSGGGITSLTGDVTATGTGAVAATLVGTTAVSGVINAIINANSTVTGTVANLATLSGQYVATSGSLTTLSGQFVTLSGQYNTTSGIVTTATGNIASLSGSLATLSGQFVTLSGAYNTTSGIVTSQTSSIALISGNLNTVSGVAYAAAPKTTIVTGTTGQITGGGTLASNQTFGLATAGPGSGALGTTSAQTPNITVDVYGRVISVTNNSIAIAESQVTNLTTDLAAKFPNTGGTISGNLTVASGLTVNGSTTSVSGLSVGSASVSGVINVLNPGGFTNALNAVAGFSATNTLPGTTGTLLNTAGGQTVNGTMTIANNFVVASGLTVSGALSVASEVDTGAMTVGGNLTVTGTSTHIGNATFSGTLTVASAIINPILQGAYEVVSYSGSTVLSGTTTPATLNAANSAFYFYNTAPASGFTVAITGAPTVSGRSATFALLVNNGATAYLPTNITINGNQAGASSTALPLQAATNNNITTYYQGGTAWSAADVSTLDSYTFTVICTSATPTWVLLAGLTKF